MTAPVEPTDPSNLFTPFLPATFNIPEEDDRQRIFLNDKLSAISDVVNDKKIGAYTQDTENFNGNKFIYDTTKIVRNGYQAIARIKSFIPQTITLPIPNVNSQFIISLVYGSASKPCSAVGAGDGDYFSFFSRGDARIGFSMSDTQLVINTDGNRAAYQGFIIIEYIRNGT
jgi:hypothetical protein